MTDVREIVADNIIKLRMSKKLTQAEFAEIMNYSDKAVSKWERNKSIPDITVLVRIAEFFGVTVDYLVTEHNEEEQLPDENEIEIEKVAKKKRSHRLISDMSLCLVWVIALLAFAFVKMDNSWMIFIYASAISAIVWTVFSCIWFERKVKYFAISLLMWACILSVYLTLLLYFGINLWYIFVAGVPGQVIIILWSLMNKKVKKNEN